MNMPAQRHLRSKDLLIVFRLTSALRKWRMCHNQERIAHKDNEIFLGLFESDVLTMLSLFANNWKELIIY